MTAIDAFFDDAHACLVHIQELLNKLGPINIAVPVRDRLTPEEAQDALVQDQATFSGIAKWSSNGQSKAAHTRSIVS